MGSSWDDLDLDDTLPQAEGISYNSDGSEVIDLFSEDEDQNWEFPENLVSSETRSTKSIKVTAGRIVLMVLTGLISSFVIFLAVAGLYTRFIRFPSEQERIWEQSRLYALQNFCSEVNTYSVSVEDSYIMREESYANDNVDRERFMKYVLRSVSYDTYSVPKRNVFGNELVDKDTGEILYELSWLEEDEKAVLSYIDYNSIVFNEDRLKLLIEEAGLTATDIDYKNKLTDLFCRYIYGINVEDLPILSEDRVPQMAPSETGYSALLSEDVYLDRVLFSSNELYSCFERFAESVAGLLEVELTESTEYQLWLQADDNNIPAPERYGKRSISHTWCGSYYLINDYTESGERVEVTPNLGNGSVEQPASVGTPVITYVIREGNDGSVEKLPIRITLKEYGVSQKALDWFQKKNIQNRGYDVTSEVQYCYFVFEVTNLSNEVLTITDNFTLCDLNANSSGRTGIIYGLQDSVTLSPEEKGIIETWSRSTELNLKYVIWGKDFARRENPVWFRVLAGDLEDTSWDKGVYINDTRG